MVYKRNDRKGWWYRIDYPTTGKRVQRYGGPTRRKAKVAKHRLIQKLMDEAAAAPRQLPDSDFNRFIEILHWPGQKAHLTPKARDRECGIINKHLGPFFAGDMREIKRTKILKYIEHRKIEKRDKDGKIVEKAASSGTIRKELAILKHVCRIACKPDLAILERNPFDYLEESDWPQKGEERTRHLLKNEWGRLLLQIPFHMRPAVIMLVNTGLRRGELMRLRWRDLNLETGIGYIPNRSKIKNRKPKWFRLSEELVLILEILPHKAEDDSVFWMFTANALTVAFSRAVRKAKISDFHLHDLRHSFATELRKRGNGLDVIARLLGHSDLRMTQRYAHLGDEILEQAIQSIQGVFTQEALNDLEEDKVN